MQDCEIHILFENQKYEKHGKFSDSIKYEL